MEVAVQLVALSDGGAEETLMLGKVINHDISSPPLITRI